MKKVGISNSVSRAWDSKTLNDVLRQLRKQGATVKRDYSAGTVVVYYISKKKQTRYEILWGLQKGRGGMWIMRFDSKVIIPKQ